MKPQNVLLIENNRANRTVYAGALVSYGYTVTEAMDTDQAHQFLRQGLNPDMIIVDVRFNDDNTHAFMQEIQTRDSRLIVVSGRVLPNTQADAFLSKPLELDTLLAAVQSLN